MLIDFISDLHLEINENIKLEKEPGGDILILPGDITCMRFFRPSRTDAEARSMQKRFRELLSDFCIDYKQIFYLPGNHEYYGHYFHNADSDFREIIESYDSRLKFVNNQSIQLEDTLLIFSTLWTNYNNNHWNKIVAQNSMSDYRYISQYKDGDLDYNIVHSVEFNQNKLSPDVIYNFNQISFNFIRSSYEKRNTSKTIVITHHAPSFMSHDKNRHGLYDDLTPAFCSEYGDWISNSNITYWIHGHTHSDVNYYIGDTKILGTMYGYKMHDFIPHKGYKKKIARIKV